jgi:hypothetical protein
MKILEIMAKKAEKSVKEGKIDPKLGLPITTESLKTRKFWLLPADQTPDCETIPTYEDGDDEELEVMHLAAIKIPIDHYVI